MKTAITFSINTLVEMKDGKIGYVKSDSYGDKYVKNINLKSNRRGGYDQYDAKKINRVIEWSQVEVKMIEAGYNSAEIAHIKRNVEL